MTESDGAREVKPWVTNDDPFALARDFSPRAVPVKVDEETDKDVEGESGPKGSPARVSAKS